MKIAKRPIHQKKKKTAKRPLGSQDALKGSIFNHDMTLKFQLQRELTHQSFILYALSKCCFFTRFKTSPMCSEASCKFVTRTWMQGQNHYFKTT
jgi:hypothetical protein